ncbi:MAG: Smr/MutS family protein [Synergistaceae bacterium]|nr:Smr/MutS family protein [Synergistaceae bacterium]
MRVSPSVLELLEFRKALFPIRERLSGELGERALDALDLAESFDALRSRQALLREWMDMLDRGGALQWNAGVPAVTPLFEGARRSGFLSGEELLAVRAVLVSARQAREGLSGLVERRPALEILRRRLRDFTPEIDALGVIEDSGRLSDSASPKLTSIRGELEALKRSGRRTAQRLLDDTNIQNMLQERSLSWRDGRFLLLVRQEYINRFPGLAVERSASGNSVYMEPRLLSSVNHGLMMRTRDERDEERLILLELTRKILNRDRAVADAERALGELDLLSVCDTLVRTKGWTLPELTQRREFAFVGARHPLLREAAVPVDVRCGGSLNDRASMRTFNALVVTGPNTGGKTLILKTAGLLLAMGWSGLPLPARDGTRVGTFDALYADIGDEQSIEQNLSTFSAHLKKIIEILREATDASVVLLDELGSGTDPQEGAALGVAILETLRRRGGLTLATTHHNPIKQYALTTPGVETASMEFDAERLTPTYRLLMGVPGRSNALMIARRYGMPEEVLALAQGELDAREVSAEELMGELNERQAALTQAERDFQDTVAEAERLKQTYRDRVAEIDRQRDTIMEAADRKAESLIRRAEETSRGMIRDLEGAVKIAARQGMANKQAAARKLRGEMEKRHNRRVEREVESRPAAFTVEPGATVQVAGSGIVGLVESVKNGRAELTAGAMHLEVPVEKLLPTEKKAKVAVPVSDSPKRFEIESVPPSIMVRGMDVATAMPLVESYLDRAYRSNHSSVTVIHGRGEGILRREVHALCARLRYVKDYRLGGEGEGGFGVTIVNFH